MTRLASSTNVTESQKVGVTLLILADLDFASGHVYVHDGIGDVTTGGHTYSGVGTFGGISTVSEGTKDIARPLSLTLSGVENSLLTTAMTEVYQGRTATIYLGLLNDATGTFVDTPETIYEGRMARMQIQVGKTSTITLHIENRIRREPRIARYTSEDQQLLFSGDTFFDQIPNIAGAVGQWGATPVGYTPTPGYTRNGITKQLA